MTAQRIATVVIVVAAALLAPACQRKANVGTTEQTAAGNRFETTPPPSMAAACQACLKANAVPGPGNDGCCRITDPVGKQLCEAVAACLRAGGPPVGACNKGGDTTTCYCGTNQLGCDTDGKANGPCIPQITAAAARNISKGTTDSPSPEQVLSRYGDAKYALGPATNIASIAGVFCKSECGVGM